MGYLLMHGNHFQNHIKKERCNDKAKDDLSMVLLEMDWKEFTPVNWEKWKREIGKDNKGVEHLKILLPVGAVFFFNPFYIFIL